ncbi:hypothetical protein UPYG_G00039220 [Umbra pygmaea]|uniref:Adhesion G-protein coupled receptor D2-like n=1 Tax=Umbra pygmaea TaxID=75934 RepID=A0ABD0XPM0_UMBPY
MNMIIYLNFVIWFHHYTDAAMRVESGTPSTYLGSYFEYVPDELRRDVAWDLCNQRSGTLATASDVFQIRELTTFLRPLNITLPVWATRTPVPISKNTYILEFTGRSEVKNARLLHKFPAMGALTACIHVRFDPACYGLSTVFSYSVQSFINEFQLRASLSQGKPVQLAVVVHGSHGAYHNAFLHDGSWHSLCVSWSGHGGRWALYADGQQVSAGKGLHSSGDVGPNGHFILGQEQDSFGGSFKSAESFSGSLTQLHIWERVLNDSEIHTMENECSPILSGLAFRWSLKALEVASSLKGLWGDSPCQVNRSEPNSEILRLLMDVDGPYHNFSLEALYTPKPRECETFDPVNGSWSLDVCTSLRGSVCQFEKEILDIFSFPKTVFFTRVSRAPLAKHGVKMSVNASSERDLMLLSALSSVLLEVVETSPNILSSTDVLYLSEMMKVDATTNTWELNTPLVGPGNAEIMVSITTNFLKLASLILDPKMAAQWLDWTDDAETVRPFTIVESIEKLTTSLADVLFAEGTSFTLATENIDVHVQAQKLCPKSSSFIFDGRGSSTGRDQMLISDTEVQRLHALGHKEVMLIHTYYNNLFEIQSKIDASPEHQPEKTSASVGHLSTAVTSATVRDPSKAQNIPVAVQYTLFSHVVGFFPRGTPVCVFWNFTLMTRHSNGWSSEGCWVTNTGSDVTSCFCNHTTNFAVMMNYMEDKWSPEEEVILMKLTFIGSGASLCALLVTLMLFTVLDIPKSDRTSIHKNLFVALTCAQIVLLCSGSAVNNKVTCTLVAALLHFFFMAAFSWMLVEGLLLWSKVVTVNLSEEQHMKYYYLIGWGLPVLIVTITLASASGNYSADGHCWLSVQNGVIWGFTGPVIFIITVNAMVLTRVVVITISTAKRRSSMLASGSSPVEQAYEQIRAAVKAVLVLLPILGLTWLCGVLVPFSTVMAYVFILLNSLQGLSIFLIYGVYNTEVRSTVNRIKERRKAHNFSNCGSSRPSSSVTSSRLAGLSTPSPQDPQRSSPDEEGTQSGSIQASLLSNTLHPSHTLSLMDEIANRDHLSIPCATESLQDSTGGQIPRKRPGSKPSKVAHAIGTRLTAQAAPPLRPSQGPGPTGPPWPPTCRRACQSRGERRRFLFWPECCDTSWQRAAGVRLSNGGELLEH